MEEDAGLTIRNLYEEEAHAANTQTPGRFTQDFLRTQAIRKLHSRQRYHQICQCRLRIEWRSQQAISVIRTNTTSYKLGRHVNLQDSTYFTICKFWNSRQAVCRPQWPRGLRRGSAAASLLGLWVRIRRGAWMSVCCECCVLSGRGLCDEPITRPEESYRMWWVVVCDLGTSWMMSPWPTGGRGGSVVPN